MGSGGVGTGPGGVQATSGRWPQPDPACSSMRSRRGALPPCGQSGPTAPGTFHKKHRRADLGSESPPGPGVHSNSRRGGEGALGIFCYQLYYISAFGVALLPVRMNCCQKQGTKRGQRVRSNKTDYFSSTGRPRVPSLASEGCGCVDLASATSPVSSLCRGQATCGLFKPQPSKPPGGLLLQGRREVPAPGD